MYMVRVAPPTGEKTLSAHASKEQILRMRLSL